jgi:hypothetical protein
LRVRNLDDWLAGVRLTGSVVLQPGQEVPVSSDTRDLLEYYLRFSESQMAIATAALRSESEALRDCEHLGISVAQTRTRSADHHQSSKALVAEVSHISAVNCRERGLAYDTNPQRRAVWIRGEITHVSARNLDGVIPALLNPFLVWEIKEYWGKTSGGSKMSDAVYECQLVGLELRHFEQASGARIHHVVFLDGKDQWASRKSDLVRFIDLASQGLIDRLIIGRQVATEWPAVLRESAVGPRTST